MVRLIDADALIRSTIYNTRHVPYITKSDIEDAPTVDAVPIRRGKWKEHKDYPGLAYLCSDCGYFTTDRSRFCPNCGARMVEE